MPKQASALNLSSSLGTPIRSTGGGGTGGGTGSSGSGGGTGGAGSGGGGLPIDYHYSAEYRYSSLPNAERLSKTRAEEQDLAAIAHLKTEQRAPRLAKLTKPRIIAWRAESIKYLKRGGRQSALSRIDPDAIHGINSHLEERFKKEMDFDSLSEKEKLDILADLFTEQKSSHAKFEADLLQISLANKAFDMDAHTEYLGDFKKLTKDIHPEFWATMSKEAQLRALISGFAPLSFQNAVIKRLRFTLHATYYDGLSLIAEEAQGEQIRTVRNIAARSVSKTSPSPAPKKPPITSDDDLPDIDIDSSDSEAEPVKSPSKVANVASRVPKPCENCLEAQRIRIAANHVTADCERRCNHPSCVSTSPHLCADKGKILCHKWLPGGLARARDHSPYNRRDSRSHRDDSEDSAQEARLAAASRNARKAANAARINNYESPPTSDYDSDAAACY